MDTFPERESQENIAIRFRYRFGADKAYCWKDLQASLYIDHEHVPSVFAIATLAIGINRYTGVSNKTGAIRQRLPTFYCDSRPVLWLFERRLTRERY